MTTEAPQVETPATSEIANLPKLRIDLRCGACLHFDRNAIFRAGGKPVVCSKLGVKKTSTACENFALDPVKADVVAFNNDYTDLLKSIQTKHLKQLAALMVYEARLRKHDLKYGQVVKLTIPDPNSIKTIHGKKTIGEMVVKAKVVMLVGGTVFLRNKGAIIQLPLATVKKAAGV